ncbi:MAG: ATP synthase F1 subunit gamma [Vicinamibacterales bacterium]
MPSLIDLRRRVRAVKNTQQITKAMKMVAASKLRRAQERITNARPYAVQMQHVLAGLAGRVDASIHPLLTAREQTPDSRTLIISVTGDKGLCGSFNTNAIKAVAQTALNSPMPVTLGLVGRKGREYFGRRGYQVEFEQTGIFQKLSFANAQTIATLAIDAFTSGRADKVLLVYNEFRSVISQKVVVDQLLPIARTDGGAVDTGNTSDYLYEPSAQKIFDELLPRYVEVQVYRALLDSNAAFYAAQMTAMDTATRNSADMIGSLTLYMNKVRQAAITREIIEVVSGAQAL